MRKYLLLICSFYILCTGIFAQVPVSKMSRYVRSLACGASVENSRGQYLPSADGGRMTCVLVRASSPSDVCNNGGRILASFDDIHIVALPVNRLNDVASLSSVSRIEAGKPSSLCVDTARIAANVTSVWNYTDDRYTKVHSPILPTLYTGKDVIIGVQDVGFDLTHPNFFSRDGKRYAIKRFWDMLAEYDEDVTHGSKPNVTNGDANAFVPGLEYTTEEDILRKAHSTDGYTLTHGTHTTGIAAGSGYNTPLTGIAPDAELCLVSNAVGEDMAIIPKDQQGFFTTATDLLGFKYIFDYADERGLPCVINFSEGEHQDYYETILYDEVLRKLTGPGRIIVASAGNEAYHLTYLGKPKGKTKSQSLISNSAPYALVQFHSDGEAHIHVSFDHLSENPVTYHFTSVGMESDSLYSDTINVNGTDYAIQTVVYPDCYDNSKIAGELLMERLGEASDFGNEQKVCITVVEPSRCHDGIIDENKPVTNGTNTEVNYLSGYFQNSSLCPTDADNTHNVHFPSSSPYVICVGATNTRRGFLNIKNEWIAPYWGEIGERSGYSSIGPTLDGRSKPDVYAPGTFLTSSYSTFYHENYNSSWDVAEFEYAGRTYLWHGDCGTSMATPVAAGVIALWLQACPTLTREQVMEVIDNTSQPIITDSAYDQWPVKPEGNMCSIDAYKGLVYVLEHFTDGIQTVTTDTSADNNAIYDLQGRRLNSVPKRGMYIGSPTPALPHREGAVKHLK